MPKPTLLILADDLTGALDAGVQFAKHRIATGVFLTPDHPAPAGGETPEVLVINTGVRHRSPGEAREITARCVRRYREAAHVYQKTDSTLRGRIGAELDALMEARGAGLLPFVPAYPDLGRTTKGGHQYLRGKPVHETEMARDPLNPVKTSFIPAILGEESAAKVLVLPSGGPVPEDAAEGPERRILVFDGETVEDLRQTARRLFDRGLLRESAGCAGFAEALRAVLPFERREVRAAPPPPKLPLLVISGSRNPVSLAQVQAALDSGVPGFAAPGDQLLDPAWFASAPAETLADKAAGALRERGLCVLGTGLSLGLAAPPPEPAAAGTENVSGRLGGLVREILRRTGPLNLAVFGGDTLLGIMESLGYTYIRPGEEIRPGVVLARAEGPGGSSIIVTKSGAFGDPDLIPAIAGYFDRE